MSLALVLLAVALGASFIGAEYRAGTVETQLLWEPRRARVLGAKLTALGGSVFVVHVILLGVLVMAVLPAAWFRGSTAGVDGVFWSGLVWAVARGGAVSALAAVFAASVTVVARHTAAAIFAVLGYAILGPLVVTTAWRWLYPRDLMVNTLASVVGGEVGRYELAQFGGWVLVFDHGTVTALVYAAAYTALVAAAATVVFLRRDVT